MGKEFGFREILGTLDDRSPKFGKSLRQLYKRLIGAYRNERGVTGSLAMTCEDG